MSDLANAETIYCDGTFYTCPSLFLQIYSIHTQVDGIMVPVVYALLPGKSQAVYTRFLSLLQTEMTNRGLPFSPSTVFLDFETAAQNAFLQSFPGTSIKGCFFHYTQCIWRKVQACGLQIPYRDNENIRTVVRRAAVLPLVPLPHIEDVWFEALDELQNTDRNVQQFLDYVTTQWIESDRSTWNHYDTVGPRTTNNLEAWHGKLKRKIQHSHPNIFTIIQAFKDIQNYNEISRIQINAGGLLRPRGKRYVNIDRRLVTLKERYSNGIIDLMTFADSASHLIHLD